MVNYGTSTNKILRMEISFFPRLLKDFNLTIVEKALCTSSAEIIAMWILFSIELFVICLAFYGLCCLFRSDQPVSVFVINLFISDIIQICIKPVLHYCALNIVVFFGLHIYVISLQANIGFMVCISLERYIMIKYPVWYRFHRSFKHSVLICLLVWVIPCAEVGIVWILVLKGHVGYVPLLNVFIFLMPYPLVVFSLVGSWRALSNSVSVTPEDRRKILRVLTLVLFSYTVLFLPSIVQYTICFVSFEHVQTLFDDLHAASGFLLYLNPLADSLLYVFLRKDTNYTLRCSCCKKLNENRSSIYLSGRGKITSVSKETNR